jgi:lysine/ornithine N-monooxygenase
VACELKSEGFASSLSDPESKFTLQDYCHQEEIPYSARGVRQAACSSKLTDCSGQRERVEADHVIAATGYQVDLDRVAFLDAKLCAKDRGSTGTVGEFPVIGSWPVFCRSQCGKFVRASDAICLRS